MAAARVRRVQSGAGQRQRAADLLLVLAGLALFFTLLFMAYDLWEDHRAGRDFTAAAFFHALGRFTVGLALAAFFVALSWTLQVLDNLARTLDRFRGAVAAWTENQAEPERARPGPPTYATPDSVRQVRELLEELRDYALMTPEQKKERWLRLLAQRRANLQEVIQDLLRQKKFVDALHELDRFEELHGRDEETVALRRKYDAARRTAERRDLAEALDAYPQFKANREWDRARKTAEDLLTMYPQSIEIREWITQIGRDREQVTAVQRAALFREVQEHIGKRKWRQALGTARKLREEFADSAEAAAIDKQMETLEANAEIETRQELENEIKDLIRDRKFSEALDLANQVIVNYPESPQAEALRSQLPRLQQRAAATTGSNT